MSLSSSILPSSSWRVFLLQLGSMSVDSASPQSLPCPEASNSREPSPVPEIYEPEENYASLPMSSAETLHTETGKKKLNP